MTLALLDLPEGEERQRQRPAGFDVIALKGECGPELSDGGRRLILCNELMGPLQMSADPILPRVLVRGPEHDRSGGENDEGDNH